MVVHLSVSIDIQGVKFADDLIKNVSKTVAVELTAGIKDATLFATGEVKASIAGRRAEPTSVDTGRFLNSVEYSYGINEGKVFTDIDYAKYLEYGTSRIAPRRHFRNSLYRNQDKFNKIIDGRITEAVAKMTTNQMWKSLKASGKNISLSEGALPEGMVGGLAQFVKTKNPIITLEPGLASGIKDKVLKHELTHVMFPSSPEGKIKKYAGYPK